MRRYRRLSGETLVFGIRVGEAEEFLVAAVFAVSRTLTTRIWNAPISQWERFSERGGRLCHSLSRRSAGRQA